MHRQILEHFDGNIKKISAFWAMPSADTDSRTLDFCYQCASAFKAAKATRLSAEKKQLLRDGIIERMTRYRSLIDVGDTLSAVSQLAQGEDIFCIQWPLRGHDA
jgi:hypothetical protein